MSKRTSNFVNNVTYITAAILIVILAVGAFGYFFKAFKKEEYVIEAGTIIEFNDDIDLNRLYDVLPGDTHRLSLHFTIEENSYEYYYIGITKDSSYSFVYGNNVVEHSMYYMLRYGETSKYVWMGNTNFYKRIVLEEDFVTDNGDLYQWFLANSGFGKEKEPFSYVVEAGTVITFNSELNWMFFPNRLSNDFDNIPIKIYFEFKAEGLTDGYVVGDTIFFDCSRDYSINSLHENRMRYNLAGEYSNATVIYFSNGNQERLRWPYAGSNQITLLRDFIITDIAIYEWFVSNTKWSTYEPEEPIEPAPNTIPRGTTLTFNEKVYDLNLVVIVNPDNLSFVSFGLDIYGIIYDDEFWVDDGFAVVTRLSGISFDHYWYKFGLSIHGYSGYFSLAGRTITLINDLVFDNEAVYQWFVDNTDYVPPGEAEPEEPEEDVEAADQEEAAA